MPILAPWGSLGHHTADNYINCSMHLVTFQPEQASVHTPNPWTRVRLKACRGMPWRCPGQRCHQGARDCPRTTYRPFDSGVGVLLSAGTGFDGDHDPTIDGRRRRGLQQRPYGRLTVRMEPDPQAPEEADLPGQDRHNVRDVPPYASQPWPQPSPTRNRAPPAMAAKSPWERAVRNRR